MAKFVESFDCYGHPFGNPGKPKKAYEVVENNGTTYIRFNPRDKGAIHKIVESNGVTTIKWTYGSWANKENLNYNLSLEQPFVIER